MTAEKKLMIYEKALRTLPYVYRAGSLILKMVIYGTMLAGIGYTLKSSQQMVKELHLDQLFQSKYSHQRIKKQVCRHQWNMTSWMSQSYMRNN